MPHRRRSRSPLIVVLLIATLAMTAALAYEAQQAARSHRQTAENVLRDYSRFAAWELGRVARQHLLTAITHDISNVQAALRKGSLAAAVEGKGVCAGGCTDHAQLTTAFSLALPSMRMESAGAPLPDDISAMVVAAANDGLRNLKDFTCPSLRVVPASQGSAVVVWRPVHDRHDQPVSVVGFVTSTAFITRPFERMLKTSSLLPPSLLPAGANPASMVTVKVSAPNDGPQLVASGEGWSPYNATDQLSKDLGSLQLAVALRPETAERLVIGGLPRERLPLVIGLLTLTAGLVVVALVQLRREAELSRLRADFVSGVSHELRTPLAQIRMFTETLLLGRVRTPNEGRRSLEIIARETQRLIQLVENVLLFSRAERRQPEIRRETIHPGSLVTEVVEGFAPLAAARQARISLDVDPLVSLDADPDALRQVLLNLLDNAVKYGPSGQTVHVTLSCEAGALRLTVDDEGPGVATADAERIWQPFNRLSEKSSATGGAGIGLSIVRQLVALHGGSAKVERGPAGARFVVELPGASRNAAGDVAVA